MGGDVYEVEILVPIRARMRGTVRGLRDQAAQLVATAVNRQLLPIDMAVGAVATLATIRPIGEAEKPDLVLSSCDETREDPPTPTDPAA